MGSVLTPGRSFYVFVDETWTKDIIISSLFGQKMLLDVFLIRAPLGTVGGWPWGSRMGTEGSQSGHQGLRRGPEGPREGQRVPN